MSHTIRALGLFSGGLDSQVAAALLATEGLQLVCLHLETGFCREARREAVLRRQVSREGPPVLSEDLSGRYFREVVREARFGYGAGMNPCLDCRIFMLRHAAVVARRERCELIFTGDVVGQRPHEQSRAALRLIDREAGLEGRVLRPLSAGLLPETEAERSGRVERNAMERIHGRSRRAQLDLADRQGLAGCPTPSGGCCWLADRAFARRLRDRLDHGDGRAPRRGEIERLKRGRHFRLAWNVKVLVGRNEAESRWLAADAGGGWTGQVASGRGAFALLEGEPDERRLRSAASLIARYCRERESERVEVVFRRGGEVRSIESRPALPERIERWRL